MRTVAQTLEGAKCVALQLLARHEVVLGHRESPEVEVHLRLLRGESDLGVEVARDDVRGFGLRPATPRVLEPGERVVRSCAADDAAALLRELERPLDERLGAIELEPQ